MAKIFIAYRRADDPNATDRIYEALRRRFGAKSVFLDIRSVPPGTDFRTHIDDLISKCHVVLVIIGDRWFDRDETGDLRLADPTDFLRLEIEAALSRGLPVIPVLVGRAINPKESELPESIRHLAYLNAVEVRPGILFQTQVKQLISGINKSLSGPQRLFAFTSSRQTQLTILFTTVTVSIMYFGLYEPAHESIGSSTQIDKRVALSKEQTDWSNREFLTDLVTTYDYPFILRANSSTYIINEPVQIRMDIPVDGYLNVVTVDAIDAAVVLFPNRYHRNNFVPAGWFDIPTPKMDFELPAAEPVGPTLIVGFLSEEPVNFYNLTQEYAEFDTSFAILPQSVNSVLVAAAKNGFVFTASLNIETVHSR